MQLPNGHCIQSHATCTLAIPDVSPQAQQAHIFKELKHSLLSISQLCDNGCEAKFDSHTVTISKNNNSIIIGNRDPSTGLWTVDLNEHQPANHHSNNIIQISEISDLTQFLHAACFSPTPSMLVKAINNGHFTTWPGFTAEAVTKHLPKSEATIKGRMDQRRKNIQSTKPKTSPKPEIYINFI